MTDGRTELAEKIMVTLHDRTGADIGAWEWSELTNIVEEVLIEAGYDKDGNRGGEGV